MNWQTILMSYAVTVTLLVPAIVWGCLSIGYKIGVKQALRVMDEARRKSGL